jgi:Putative Actinobacterial Holin-X, holin superfamily III
MVDTESARAAGAAADPSLGDLVSQAAADLSILVRSEIDLAKIELRKDVRRFATIGVMGVGCFFAFNLVIVLLSFGLVYGLIRLGIWPWASFLIVAGVDMVAIGIAAGIAWINFRRVSGLKLTRKTVQEDLAIMNREDQATGAPAVEAR